ncbi:MAG: serine/threonine-protein kinase [Aggregatilineales bacterium]
MTTASDVLINHRYRLLSAIGQGGMGIVFRALDRLTATEIALKRVKLRQANDITTSFDATDAIDLRLRFSQEFRLLASLRHPHIISVLDYGFDDSRMPFFTMELLDNTQTIVQAAQMLAIREKANLLIQMLQALVYLHRRSVIHRDLKPDNVLVVGGKVKVLDFGLAVGRFNQEASSDDDHVSGTLLYMAPEAFKGQKITEISDIYAAGIIAYEMFTGHHPFNPHSPDFTISSLIDGQIDAAQLPDIPALRSVIMRMVEHDVQTRAQNLEPIIDSLRAFTDDKDTVEALAIRESFLQSASFVGREHESAKLVEALAAAQAGKGSIWLIGGESGVGKSRLIDELQTQALVDGALVLRGQAVAEGGAPYQVWLPMLRRMVLQTPLSALEAGILRKLIPDIERLLEQSADAPPDLEGQAAQQRILDLIEAMFRRQDQPIVALLEDLHWAAEGLIILKRLASIAVEMPLLIIGTYRDDEYPTLPTELPGAQYLKLERFDTATITQLAESMVGAAGRTREISTLLQRETEGNVLFIIEVVRALSEESGGLSRVGQVTFPRSVLAGGIKTVLLRRLEKVPIAARPMLQIAAVTGRELDLKLIQAVFSDLNLENWLAQIASVTEVQENRYRFAHDKLREALLDQIGTEQQSSLHEQVAIALDRLYANDRTQYMALAYHWEKANDDRPPDRIRLLCAIDHLEKAADLFVSQNAFVQSKAVYLRLLALHERYQALVPGGVAPTREATWNTALASIEVVMSNYNSALAYGTRALQLYGYRVPASSFGLTIGLLREVIRQTGHRLLPSRFVGKASAAKRERLRAVTILYTTYSTASFALTRQLPGLYTALRSVNLHEYAGLNDQLASDYALMVNLTGAVGLNRIAEHYYQQTRALAAQYPDGTPYALFLTGVYYISSANRKRAEADLLEAAASHERSKNTVGRCLCQTTLASLYNVMGDFKRAYQLFGQTYETAIAGQIPAIELVTLASLGRLDILFGQLPLATERLDRAITLISASTEPSIAISARAFRAEAYWRQGEAIDALQMVDHTLQLIKDSKASPNFSLVAFIALADLLLEALEVPTRLPVETAQNVLREQARKLIKALNRLPANTDKSGTYRVHAKLLWLEGKSAQAERLCKKVLTVATAFGTPYEAALAHYELGRHLAKTDSERKAHLEAAISAFRQFAFPRDLEVALNALGAGA